MDELLTRVLASHGGLESWAQVNRVTARMSLGGPFWGWKGWPDVYAGQTVTLDPRHERVTFEPFTAPDRVSVFDVTPPERVEIRSTDGQLVEARDKPRTSFPAHENDTVWDAI